MADSHHVLGCSSCARRRPALKLCAGRLESPITVIPRSHTGELGGSLLPSGLLLLLADLLRDAEPAADAIGVQDDLCGGNLVDGTLQQLQVTELRTCRKGMTRAGERREKPCRNGQLRTLMVRTARAVTLVELSQDHCRVGDERVHDEVPAR